jgi:hypothetical protein
VRICFAICRRDQPLQQPCNLLNFRLCLHLEVPNSAAPATRASIIKLQCTNHTKRHAAERCGAHAHAPGHPCKRHSAPHQHTRMHQQHTQASESCSAPIIRRGMLLGAMVHTRVPLRTLSCVQHHISTRACTSNTRRQQKAVLHERHEKACS